MPETESGPITSEEIQNTLRSQIRTSGALSASDIVFYLSQKGYKGDKAFEILEELGKMPDVGKTKVRGSLSPRKADIDVYYIKTEEQKS